jgi:hypothetical protein
VPTSTVNQLVFGKRRSDGTTRPIRRIKRDTAEKLLALRPDPALLAGGAVVDATGTHRRVQALITLGWSQSEIGRRIGIAPSNMAAVMHRSHITAATARAVRETYEQLWNRRPPETCQVLDRRQLLFAVRVAARKRVDGGLRGRVVDGVVVPGERRQPAVAAGEVAGPAGDEPLPLLFLIEAGESIAAIASRYGASEDGVHAALRRSTAA